jgi:hypothetical protein
VSCPISILSIKKQNINLIMKNKKLFIALLTGTVAMAAVLIGYPQAELSSQLQASIVAQSDEVIEKKGTNYLLFRGTDEEMRESEHYEMLEERYEFFRNYSNEDKISFARFFAVLEYDYLNETEAIEFIKDVINNKETWPTLEEFRQSGVDYGDRENQGYSNERFYFDVFRLAHYYIEGFQELPLLVRAALLNKANGHQLTHPFPGTIKSFDMAKEEVLKGRDMTKYEVPGYFPVEVIQNAESYMKEIFKYDCKTCYSLLEKFFKTVNEIDEEAGKKYFASIAADQANNSYDSFNSIHKAIEAQNEYANSKKTTLDRILDRLSRCIEICRANLSTSGYLNSTKGETFNPASSPAVATGFTSGSSGADADFQLVVPGNETYVNTVALVSAPNGVTVKWADGDLDGFDFSGAASSSDILAKLSIFKEEGFEEGEIVIKIIGKNDVTQLIKIPVTKAGFDFSATYGLLNLKIEAGEIKFDTFSSFGGSPSLTLEQKIEAGEFEIKAGTMNFDTFSSFGGSPSLTLEQKIEAGEFEIKAGTMNFDTFSSFGGSPSLTLEQKIEAGEFEIKAGTMNFDTFSSFGASSTPTSTTYRGSSRFLDTTTSLLEEGGAQEVSNPWEITAVPTFNENEEWFIEQSEAIYILTSNGAIDENSDTSEAINRAAFFKVLGTIISTEEDREKCVDELKTPLGLAGTIDKGAWYAKYVCVVDPYTPLTEEEMAERVSRAEAVRILANAFQFVPLQKLSEEGKIEYWFQKETNEHRVLDSNETSFIPPNAISKGNAALLILRAVKSAKDLVPSLEVLKSGNITIPPEFLPPSPTTTSPKDAIPTGIANFDGLTLVVSSQSTKIGEKVKVTAIISRPLNSQGLWAVQAPVKYSHDGTGVLSPKDTIFKNNFPYTLEITEEDSAEFTCIKEGTSMVKFEAPVFYSKTRGAATEKNLLLGEIKVNCSGAISAKVGFLPIKLGLGLFGIGNSTDDRTDIEGQDLYDSQTDATKSLIGNMRVLFPPFAFLPLRDQVLIIGEYKVQDKTGQGFQADLNKAAEKVKEKKENAVADIPFNTFIISTPKPEETVTLSTGIELKTSGTPGEDLTKAGDLQDYESLLKRCGDIGKKIGELSDKRRNLYLNGPRNEYEQNVKETEALEAEAAKCRKEKDEAKEYLYMNIVSRSAYNLANDADCEWIGELLRVSATAFEPDQVKVDELKKAYDACKKSAENYNRLKDSYDKIEGVRTLPPLKGVSSTGEPASVSYIEGLYGVDFDALLYGNFPISNPNSPLSSLSEVSTDAVAAVGTDNNSGATRTVVIPPSFPLNFQYGASELILNGMNSECDECAAIAKRLAEEIKKVEEGAGNAFSETLGAMFKMPNFVEGEDNSDLVSSLLQNEQTFLENYIASQVDSLMEIVQELEECLENCGKEVTVELPSTIYYVEYSGISPFTSAFGNYFTDKNLDFNLISPIDLSGIVDSYEEEIENIEVVNKIAPLNADILVNTSSALRGTDKALEDITQEDIEGAGTSNSGLKGERRVTFDITIAVDSNPGDKLCILTAFKDRRDGSFEEAGIDSLQFIYNPTLNDGSNSDFSSADSQYDKTFSSLGEIGFSGGQDFRFRLEVLPGSFAPSVTYLKVINKTTGAITTVPIGVGVDPDSIGGPTDEDPKELEAVVVAATRGTELQSVPISPAAIEWALKAEVAAFDGRKYIGYGAGPDPLRFQIKDLSLGTTFMDGFSYSLFTGAYGSYEKYLKNEPIISSGKAYAPLKLSYMNMGIGYGLSLAADYSTAVTPANACRNASSLKTCQYCIPPGDYVGECPTMSKEEQADFCDDKFPEERTFQLIAPIIL